MILQALNDHYQRLLEDPDSGVAPLGYSPAKVTHAVVINSTGMLVDIQAIALQQGKKKLPKIMMVPEKVIKTSGISANILCDNTAYVLGIERDKQDIPQQADKKKFDEFKRKNVNFLEGIKCPDVEALCCFLRSWLPENALTNQVIIENLDSLLDGSDIVFKLDGTMGFIHNDPIIQAAWENRAVDKESEMIGQCLIRGAELPIARIHPPIKGVAGAQTSGALIVSFNVESFTSYSKAQSYNAPVSSQAAFAYSTALNYLIASDTNRVRLADTTMVFWADRKGSRAEETVLAWCFDPIDAEADTENNQRCINPAAARQAKTILERVKSGLPIGDSSFNPDTRCYLLGLAPNAARLSVRFWQVSSFGEVLDKIAVHYGDMDIDGLDRLGGMVSPWRTLKALAVQEDAKNIPPLLGGQFLKSILSGQMYPQAIYNAALIRCRAGGDHNGVTTIRAAIIKTFLKRKYRMQNQNEKEALITVGLNEDNVNTGYRLGRLFSLLEKVQKDALGNNINATISDRYFGAASATPGSVFPLLLRLSRHHIAKAKYGSFMDEKIQEVINGLDAFPKHLNFEDQGQFILGYYHQNQANYKKNEINEETEG